MFLLLENFVKGRKKHKNPKCEHTGFVPSKEPEKETHNCTDHLGNEFESLKSMALSYWLPPSILYARLNRKWDLKRALTTPIAKPRGKYASNIQRQKI